MATVKQRKTAAILMESKGKKSVSQAMREAGYPATTAKNPQQLTRSKSWEALIEDYLPEEKLLKPHREQLKATVVAKDGHKSPDNDARLRALN